MRYRERSNNVTVRTYDSTCALTDSSGTVSKRYVYTAYGQPTFLNASATVETGSAAGNRFTFTAGE